MRVPFSPSFFDGTLHFGCTLLRSSCAYVLLSPKASWWNGPTAFLTVACFACVLLFAPKVAGPDLVARMGKLGAVAAVQPSFVPSDADVVIKRLR